ncbi:MAG: hypothetical protein ABR575_08300 [Actinomycetota bacterium]
MSAAAVGIVIVAAMVAVAIYYVVGPLRRGAATAEPAGEPETHEASGRTRAALDAIVDLEQERLVGKLSDDDFAVLRATYEAEAIAALRQLDALATPGGDAELPSGGPDDIEAEVAAMKLRLSCPSCGALRDGAGACVRCGS